MAEASHPKESNIFADPRQFRNDSYKANSGEAHVPARKTETVKVRDERRSRCFSNSPWWLMRNYLDQEP